MMKRLTLLVAILVGALGSLASWAPPAFASCAAPPVDSPNAFVGTVVDTALDGRQATVQREDGSTVTVFGTPSPREGVGTSVDRTYEGGVTYEFHPTNDRDPYEDNACTATHPVRGKNIPESLRDATTVEPHVSDNNGPTEAPLASASQASVLSGDFAVGAVGALVVLGAGVGALLWLRRARER